MTFWALVTTPAGIVAFKAVIHSFTIERGGYLADNVLRPKLISISCRLFNFRSGKEESVGCVFTETNSEFFTLVILGRCERKKN